MTYRHSYSGDPPKRKGAHGKRPIAPRYESSKSNGTDSRHISQYLAAYLAEVFPDSLIGGKGGLK